MLIRYTPLGGNMNKHLEHYIKYGSNDYEILRSIRWYRFNPLYWSSKYFGFGVYSQSKELNYIRKILGLK